MEDGALVAEALLTGAERTEVFSSLGHHVGIELQKHRNTIVTSRRDVKDTL